MKMVFRKSPAALSNRLLAIRRRHRAIDDRVAREHRRPVPDASLLQRLKRERLRLKDEFARMEGLLSTLSRGETAA